MTKIERVLRDLSEMYDFYFQIEKIKKQNAEKLGLTPKSSQPKPPASADKQKSCFPRNSQ